MQPPQETILLLHAIGFLQSMSLTNCKRKRKQRAGDPSVARGRVICWCVVAVAGAGHQLRAAPLDLPSHELYEAHSTLFQLRRCRAPIPQAIISSSTNDP